MNMATKTDDNDKNHGSLASNVSCADFLEFEEVLKKSRTIDDKIVYELNHSIPTQSFSKDINAADKCKGLYGKLRAAYDDRERAILRCLTETKENLEKLKTLYKDAPDDGHLLKTLKKEQNKFRLIEAEINVEEVVKQRSMKAFCERCRGVYKPPDMEISSYL